MDTNSPISLLQARIEQMKPNAVRDPITASYKYAFYLYNYDDCMYRKNPKEYEKQLKTKAATFKGKEMTSGIMTLYVAS